MVGNGWKWLEMVEYGWHEMVVRCGEGIGSTGHDTGVQCPVSFRLNCMFHKNHFLEVMA
jgi:hypothetical protein